MEGNAGCIYERPSDGKLFSPFNLKIDRMERLILINFEKDPDDIYIGFEPQYFDDQVIGKGLRVIGWRKDGFVDVYQQPGLSMENQNFDVAGKGLLDLIQRDMEEARFNINEYGVDVHFAFEDKTGRPVEVTIREGGKKPAKPFDLLAPVGDSSKNPSYLPVYFMYGFYFVRKANTRVEISINGVHYKADSFPMPMDGSKIYFMRYSKDTFLVSWNIEQNGTLSSLKEKGGSMIDDQGTVYETTEHDGHMEIKEMKSSNGKHDISISFIPPVPDIVCLEDQASMEGKFAIESDKSVGTLGGEYKIYRRGSEIEMKICPSLGWEPNEKKWMVRLIYKMASVFKNWPKSYIWTGSIRIHEDAAPSIHSTWQRKI